VLDQFARIVTENIAKRWPQPFIVDARPGASTNIGTQAVKASEPDGYTWLFTAGSALAANPTLFKNAGWDPAKDFTVVGNVSYAPLMLVVNEKVPAKTLKELIDMAKAKPDTVSTGTMYGSSAQFNLEALGAASNAKLLMVPYKGAPPVVVDLVGGSLQVGMLPPVIALPQIQAGRIRALAIAGVKRSQLFPEVPTFAEAGFPDGALVPWYGFMVPHNTPPAIVKLINTEINEALKSADVRDKLFKGGGEPAAPATLEELDRLLKSDTTKYVELIKRANITVE
jgi:tripartite-type tricarboxylate transporter receptor subunit TctC